MRMQLTQKFLCLADKDQYILLNRHDGKIRGLMITTR